jgi:hypothetical protein
LIRSAVRSLRSSAFAGILFALMRIISLIMSTLVTGEAEFSLG